MSSPLIYYFPVYRSSFIKAVSYYPKKSRLIVTMKSEGEGIPYEYHDVPLQVMTRFISAKSKGKYYNKFVKGKYPQHSEILLQKK
jgi:hypothetical protein